MTITREELADLLGVEADTIKPEDIPEAVKRPRLRGRRLSELRGLPLPNWIVPGRIPAGFTCAYSLPKRGKSFYFIELSLCQAAGAPFYGENIGGPRKVLYIAAEGGAAQVRDRAERIIKKRKLNADLIEQNWIMVDSAVTLDIPKSVEELIKQNKTFGPFAFVIVDTLARCMAGDENATQHMNYAIKGCDYIRSQFGCDLILLHHQGWASQRPRGAIALFAAVDCLIRFDRHPKIGGVTVVTVEEMRDWAPLEQPDYFTLTSGTLDKIKPPVHGVDALEEREQKARDILGTLCKGDAEVTEKQWRAAVEAAGLLDAKKRQNKDRQWKRVVDKLTEAKCIVRVGLMIRPCDPPPIDDFEDEEVPE
jgi:hypothetical protein